MLAHPRGVNSPVARKALDRHREHVHVAQMQHKRAMKKAAQGRLFNQLGCEPLGCGEIGSHARPSVANDGWVDIGADPRNNRLKIGSHSRTERGDVSGH